MRGGVNQYDHTTLSQEILKLSTNFNISCENSKKVQIKKKNFALSVKRHIIFEDWENFM